MTAPVALAYVSLPAHVGAPGRAQASVETARELARFASQEGYALATLFVDVRGRSESGLYALLEAIRRGDAVAVIVPDPGHLRHVGCLAGADARTASRYLRARLLTMNPDPAADLDHPQATLQQQQATLRQQVVDRSTRRSRPSAGVTVAGGRR